jgi:hypothetical protein
MGGGQISSSLAGEQALVAMTKLQQHMQRLEKALYSSQIEAGVQFDEQRLDKGGQLLADLLCYLRGGLHSLLIYGILR